MLICYVYDMCYMSMIYVTSDRAERDDRYDHHGENSGLVFERKMMVP